MALTFKGGIHPPDFKHFSAKKPLETAKRPTEVVVPMGQHIGAPAKPIVAKGDRVLAGQVIGEAAGFVSAPIHSPVSGTVKKIADHAHAMGGKKPAVIITVDEGEDEWQLMEPLTDLDRVEPKTLVERVREAGIVGMGGATFPTSVKLVPPPGNEFDTVILNGAECEPFLTCDHRMMLEKGEEIVKGLEILLKITGAERGIIGIEDNKPDAIAHMRKLTKHTARIEVGSCHVKYPQGAEKQLIKALTGREIPPGELPFAVNVLVQNVATAYAIWDAVINGKPLVERAVTITGPLVKEPKNLWAKVGTPVAELVEQAGGFKKPSGRFIMGGPMMGMAQHQFDLPLTKGTSGLLFLPPAPPKSFIATPCIGCASCVDVCPMNLVPSFAAQFAAAGMLDEAEKYGAGECIECGCCSFVCPAKRHLVQEIKLLKPAILKRRAERAKAKKAAAAAE